MDQRSSEIATHSHNARDHTQHNHGLTGKITELCTKDAIHPLLGSQL